MSQAQGGSGATRLTDGELDRLADYLADALDPVEAAEVVRLIAEDPRWSTAQTALVDADAAVREILAGPAAAVAPMPADIAARLDDTLRGLPGPSFGTSSTSSTATVSSLAAARAKRRRFVAGIAAVAAAAVAVVGGISVVANRTNTVQSAGAMDSTATSGGSEAAAASVPPPAWVSTEVVYLVSGTNYTFGTLDAFGKLSARRAASGMSNRTDAPQVTKDGLGQVPEQVRDSAPTSLARLLDPAALSACLDAILVIQPGSVMAVDYARFAGEPGLVVLVRQEAKSTVVVVGPDCGRSGADQKGSIEVT